MPSLTRGAAGARPARRSASRGRAGARKRRWRLSDWWPGRRTRKRAWRSLKRLPRSLRLAVLVGVLALIALGVNWFYQVARKPTELFFPVSGTLYKTPGETWREYGPLFRRHATARITPALLAALAQVEGSGNPVVRTYWRWAWRSKPFELYRPASSAVGMYQMTDGTFEEARRYCVHDHVVVQAGAWDDWHACWFNGLYFRVIPSHAVELTSAYLDLQVASALARARLATASARRTEELAAVIHLCGAGAGEAFAMRGFRFLPGQRCGDQDPRVYVARVQAMGALFERLASEG